MGVQSWIIEDETPGIDIVLDHRLRDDIGKRYSAKHCYDMLKGSKEWKSLIQQEMTSNTR